MTARRVRWVLHSVLGSRKTNFLWALRSNKGSRRNLHATLSPGHSRWHCRSLVRDRQDRTLPLRAERDHLCRRPAFDLQTTSLNRGNSCTLPGVALSDCGSKGISTATNLNQRFPACGFESLLQARMVTWVIWTEDIDHALVDDFPAVTAAFVVARYVSALYVDSRRHLLIDRDFFRPNIAWAICFPFAGEKGIR
jgi:hypothetical protein